MKKLLLVFTYLLFTLLLISCAKEEKVVITFQSNGGSRVEQIEVDKKATSINLIEPTKTGNTFLGWYFDDNFTTKFSISSLANYETPTLYAKWKVNEYNITFNVNGGTAINSMNVLFDTNIKKPSDPTKEGHTFLGWFIDNEFNTSYTFHKMPANNITIYAKWEEDETNNNHLATDKLPLYSIYYGNTNGNLNNLGLVVYDPIREVHYISLGISVHTFNPATNETSLLFTLESEGRPTYLNLDKDVLYFIDNDKGHLYAYDLIANTFKLISDTNNNYASREQSWISFTYDTVAYGNPAIAFQRYLIKTDSLTSIQGYGYEHLNIDGSRIYYKPVNNISLNVMHYSGIGKNTVYNLANAGATNQYETLLYKVNQDYVSYFALTLEVNNNIALYLYNSIDGLVKITDGKAHSLNYDGNFVYYILNNSLYKLDLQTKMPEIIYSVNSSEAFLNIINHWLYIGSYDSTNIYKINPITKTTEDIIN